MAARYWVGGTGTWDGTAGLKWADAPGGAGGKSVPTTIDDVYFDANSGAVTVTIASGNGGAKSINCTGFTGTIAGTANISVAGSITLVAGMSYTHTGTVTLTATGTLITAGKNFSPVIVSAPGGTVTLGDALNATNRSVSIDQGTFTTNNYSITCSIFVSSNTNTRTVNLGSSTVTVTSFLNFATTTGFTFNAGTSQINLQYSGGNFYGGSQTFYNVNNNTTGPGIRIFTGSNTFNLLTLQHTNLGLCEYSFEAGTTQTLTSLSAFSVGANNRNFIRSSIEGTPATLSIATLTYSISNNDFRDITVTGAVAPISPSFAGNCGGNSGITFPASKTVYRVGSATNWADSTGWALTSGGAGAANNYPLVQDTAIIDNNSGTTGATLSFGDPRNIGTLDCSSRTNALTLNHDVSSNFYGSYKLGPGVTTAGAAAVQNFRNRGGADFVSAGKTISFPILVDAPYGFLNLMDALNSTNQLRVIKGTFSANNYNVTAASFATDSSDTRTINMGSGLWTMTNSTSTPWDTSNTVGLTFNKGTANILLSNAANSQNRTFNGGVLSFNKLTIGGASGANAAVIINAGPSFTELASTRTIAHTVYIQGNLGTIGIWSITGSPGNVVTVNSISSGVRRSFTLTNITTGIDYLSVKDIGELSGNKFYVGANSTNGGNNSNVYFTGSPLDSNGNMMMLF